MIQQIYRHLAMQFKLPMEEAQQSGTSILVDEKRDPMNYQVIWTFDKHVIIRCHPQFVSDFETLIEKGEKLSLEDISKAFNVTYLPQERFYSITEDDLITHDIDYEIRQLSEEDSEAFADFQENCPESDRDMGQVGLDDEAIFAALDGERIIAAASTFEWQGFVDFGVLTDPDYRGQSVGKAVVAAIVKHYLENQETRLLLYRHETDNIGSGKIAKAVGWQCFAILDYPKFEELEIT